MNSEWLAKDDSEDIAVYVVWSSQLGAQERHVPGAAALLRDSRVRHFWDPERLVGAGYQSTLELAEPAWDVWLLFGRDAAWDGEVPRPAWWEHQLSGLPEERHLDPKRFAAKAGELLSQGDTARPE